MQAMVRELASALRLGGLLLMEQLALIQVAPCVFATLPVNSKLSEGQRERCVVESLVGRKPPFGLLLLWLLAVSQYWTRQRRFLAQVKSERRGPEVR
jgi:hypothetical protein